MAQISEVLFVVVAVMLLFGVFTLPTGAKKPEARIEMEVPKGTTSSGLPDNSLALEQAASSGKSDVESYSKDQKTAGSSLRKAKVT